MASTNTKTTNDKAKEKGASVVNKQPSVTSGISVPERIWNFLCNEKSLGSITTAAIMGNIAQESSYNVNADSTKLDGNASYGICQWTDTRKTGLINHAKSIGKDPSDLEAQLSWLWTEGNQRGDFSATKNASQGMPDKTKEEIYAKIKKEVEGFCASFERPRKGYENYPNRYNRAIEAYEKQGKGILALGNYVPQNTPGSSYMNQASAAKRGVIVEQPGKERQGHTDEYLVKPDDPDKTFCEPIYPDLTTLGDRIPSYAIPSNIPTSEMDLTDYNTVGAGLVYKISTPTIIKYSDNRDLAQFTYKNQFVENQRKQVFKKSVSRAAFKTPSAGKPPNNLDPFPVDHKVVELETHQPRCKIESVKACMHSLEVAKALVLLSTDTEKRLVRLENNMATMMRYLYRMAARVNINCVYYGGQVPANAPAEAKYNCIRCLKDDRIQDGKLVSLDQCLNCTRYEPLIGQVYDIFTDTGDNLSAILDDNQMSYTTMDEYLKFRNITERQQPLEAANLDASNVQTRNKTEIDLDDEWGPGLAMDWSLYPVELQRPHTEPPVQGSLASSFGANSGSALTNCGVQANMLIEARNQIDASQSTAKKEGEDFARTHTDTVVSRVKASVGEDIRKYYKEKNITSGQDTCLIAALMEVYGASAGSTVDKLEQIKTEFKNKGVDNIVLHVMFYSLDQKYLFGGADKDKLPVRLDKVSKNVSSQTSSIEGDSGNTLTSIMPEGAWNDVNKWNWKDFSEPLTINIENESKENGQPAPAEVSSKMINFAKVVYLYKELVGKCSASRFDTAEWGFPFTEEQITGGLCLNYSGYFGEPRPGHIHGGMDIGVGVGADAGNPSANKGIPIHAARDGVIYDIATFADHDGGGQQVYIQHDNGWTSWYMHLYSFGSFKKGDRVNRGDVIGYTGGSGSSGQAVFPEHLHYEIHQPGEKKIDPASCYTGLENGYGKQLADL